MRSGIVSEQIKTGHTHKMTNNVLSAPIFLTVVVDS
jgi:hypothetical protein